MRGSRWEKRRPHVVRERAPDYNELKRRWTDAVEIQARAQLRGVRIVEPVLLRWTWYESDRRRDPDGISSGGRKLVLDGLVAAGVLQQDGWRAIAGFAGETFCVSTSLNVGVDVDWSMPAGIAYRLVFRGRLPDLNELLAARELGARRSVRRARK